MIPARMGSKRVPKKNIRFLGGKPLIDYPIDLLKQTKFFKEIYVNTESEELGGYCIRKGIQFHHRPAELSTDTATNRDFMYEFMKKHDCDYVLMVNPTSPLITPDTLNRCIDLIKTEEFDTMLSVVNEKTECYYYGKPVNFDPKFKINSQFLEPVSRVVWALTCWKRSSFIHSQEHGDNPVFGGKVSLFPIPKYECCDIDTEEDWIVAEKSLGVSGEEVKYLDL